MLLCYILFTHISGSDEMTLSKIPETSHDDLCVMDLFDLHSEYTQLYIIRWFDSRYGWVLFRSRHYFGESLSCFIVRYFFDPFFSTKSFDSQGQYYRRNERNQSILSF